MQIAKLPTRLLLAGLAIMPLLISCARHEPSPSPAVPGVNAPDTSVNAPQPIPVTPPAPQLIAGQETSAPPIATVAAAAPAPPSPLPYLRDYRARAREAFDDGVYREAANQLRNAAELMDQIIVTAPYYTPSQAWLVAARDALHDLADLANRGELNSITPIDRGFNLASRAVNRYQADLARPPARPADAPPPPGVIP